ncbi:MAG TPA: type II toxin-antitoxin system VapC family toxin [Verrucomicrobiota bacterium]|nr:VapC toxin family PIN domain ribonuclease [Verrucomicrobiales bacterium]HRI14518.1 type II toxin-antitoxin system VapC family toxin [Verrucomicrobiota bacterium]
MSFLVDANVISEAVRRSPDAQVLNWLGVHDAELSISTITLGEVEKGIVKLPGGPRRRQLDAWLNELRSAMAGRILAFGETEASAWAHYFEKQRALGRLLPSIDSMIAATAIVHRLAVASRNVADFPGVKVVNPWIKES